MLVRTTYVHNVRTYSVWRIFSTSLSLLFCCIPRCPNINLCIYVFIYIYSFWRIFSTSSLYLRCCCCCCILLRCPDAAALLSNVRLHASFISSTVGYLSDQIQADNDILTTPVVTVSSQVYLYTRAADRLNKLIAINRSINIFNCS